MTDPEVRVADAGDRIADREHRIYILGGEGSGKTTLATLIKDALGIPLFPLDYVAWRGADGGTVALFDPRFQPPERLVARPLEERLSIIAGIAAREAWVAEGKHLWWTAELLPRAETIIWLDHVPFRTAARRVLERAARSGGRSFRQARGHRKVSRLRDYAVHSWELQQQLRTLHHFYRGPAVDEADPNDYRRSITRASTLRFLEPYRQKLVHIKTQADLERLFGKLRERDWTRDEG
jgi:hypothetical protein